MRNNAIAALIRGLCIDLTGKPQTVVCESEASASFPADAMRMEINSEETEENTALIIRKAYENWNESLGKNGSQGDSGSACNFITIPSCAVLCVNKKKEALYWIDDDLDSARKRLITKNAAPRKKYTAKETTCKKILQIDDRAAVVKNRIALVTGGAQGIGEEIVRNLAAAGALVFIADLNLEGAQKLADEINSSESRTAALALEVNVSDEASVAALLDAIADKTGGLDLCISNAGVLKAGSVLEQELSDFKFVTEINYTGFFVVSKYAGRLLRTQHRTAPLWKTDIIQINSKSGLEGSNKNGAYAGGKFGGLGLVASYAMELVEYNIKVNAICPGNFLDGPLWSHPEKGLFVQYLNTGKVKGAKTIADVRSFYEAKVPMKRGCTGKDLIRALFYIVEQEYETGQAIPVTGGQIMLH